MNDLKLHTDLKYIATLMYYDGPIEIALYDEKFDNYYLCLECGTKEENHNKYSFFNGEKEDFGLLLTSQISHNEFIRRSKYRFLGEIVPYITNNVNVIFKEHISNSDLHMHLCYDDDCLLPCACEISELPVDIFLKYVNFKISGKGLNEFISYFDAGI